MRVKSTIYTNNAAAVWAATGCQPEVIDGPDQFKEFVFPATPEVLEAFQKFDRNSLLIDARLLLERRAALLKVVKKGVPRGE